MQSMVVREIYALWKLSTGARRVGPGCCSALIPNCVFHCFAAIWSILLLSVWQNRRIRRVHSKGRERGVEEGLLQDKYAGVSSSKLV